MSKEKQPEQAQAKRTQTAEVVPNVEDGTEENNELTDEELKAAEATDEDLTHQPEDEDPLSLVGEDLSEEEEEEEELAAASADGFDEPELKSTPKFRSTPELQSTMTPGPSIVKPELTRALRAPEWSLAPSLVRLRAELDKKWPRRNKHDGTIGDKDHKPPSDHLRNSRGLVNAIDIDKDGVINPSVIVAAAKRHPATNYIIWNRRIYSRVRGFSAKRYTGENPHTDHIHISILQTKAAENSKKSWGIASGTITPPTPPIPPLPMPNVPKWPLGPNDYYGFHQGTPPVEDGVKTWQAQMKKRGWNIDADGQFGPQTLKVVKAFQREKGLEVDGKIGPKTWAAAWTAKIT